MKAFKFFPFLLALVAAFDPETETVPSCNDNDALDKGPVGISKLCSNAEINKDGWLYADCDVGSKLMRFGVGLNYCIANDEGKIGIREDGMAMNSCGQSCRSIVKKGEYAKMICTVDNCQGEIDLDKAIKYNGSYLKCGKHIGSGGSEVKKRAMRDEDL